MIDESVFAFILDTKSGKFQQPNESNTLFALYWYILWGVLPHTFQYGCGVLFIWVKAFQSLVSGKRINSTLSVYINPPFEELAR